MRFLLSVIISAILYYGTGASDVIRVGLESHATLGTVLKWAQ